MIIVREVFSKILKNQDSQAQERSIERNLIHLQDFHPGFLKGADF